MTDDKYIDLQQELEQLPFISPTQIDRWVKLQQTIDRSRDYLIRAVPEARVNVDTAQKILGQRQYTLVFFGGTGVGKSTLINALLGRNLLPTGAVTAVTGTIVYIEQAEENTQETLTLEYWTRDEFAERVGRLCQLAEIDHFDISNDGERELAHDLIQRQLNATADEAKTERDEYLEILLDCIETFENHQSLFKAEMPPPQIYTLEDESIYEHLREDAFKGSNQRQIRLIKSATFRIHPRQSQSLLMNGYLRIVDVPGLGAGMRLHEAITLEEMKKEDAMIVVVSDAGRQRVDEMKSLQAVHWVKDNRLRGLSGVDLDEAAAKIFYVVNGGNIRQAYDRLNSGLPQAERELKEVMRHIAPNYWETYRHRGDERPYYLVMPPVALHLADPKNAPQEFAGETRRVIEAFSDQLEAIAGVSIDGDADLTDPDVRDALMQLSELPALRDGLTAFIRNERVRTQLREAESRVRSALSALKGYYEQELASRSIYPPFEFSWEALQERRYENLLRRWQRDLPRAFHSALVELSQRTNNPDAFRRLIRPTLTNIQQRVEKAIGEEVDLLLEQYGTEHWDNRDVTYDNLIWGTSGIELPIKRILYQVELTMHETVSRTMPRLADIMTQELRRTLAAHEIGSRLQRAEYEQEYTYTLPSTQGAVLTLDEALDALVERIADNFRAVCEQAAMYELMKTERSIHQRFDSGDTILPPPSATRAGALAVNGVEAHQGQAEAAGIEDDAFTIRILDEDVQDDVAIRLDDDAPAVTTNEVSYADLLEDVAGKTKQLFRDIVADLFNDDDLLPRLRRLFWLEATRTERDFNLHIVKPMLRQHDRKLHNDDLRLAMAADLESISDLEALMRTWQGLDEVESTLVY